MKHIPRFHIDNSPLLQDATVSIDPQQMHHATRVLRLSAGDHVRLFHENYGEWDCSISNISACQVKCHRRIRLAENDDRCAVIACAIIHPNRMSLLLEKTTELGVSAIIPIISQYSQHKTLNTRKATQILVGACEQCGRIKIPQLHEVMTLEKFLQTYEDEYGGYRLIFGDESESIASCPVDIKNLLGQKKSVFLIGPEGGFSHQERQMILSCDFVAAVRIGSSILRSETAAIAFMSAWLWHRAI
jgi:16S rRNA (uracil1498-N3)-methyltransferase